MKKIENHPASELFPMMTKIEFDALVEDIKRNGQLVPILIFEKKILDGRNRFQACERLNIEPRFEEFKGSSPTSYVISLNAKRRHLTPGQLACVAVEALPLFEAEAKKRQKMGRELIPHPEKGKATEKLSKELKVNHRYIQDAKSLKLKNPELYSKVASGKTNLRQAMRAVKQEEYQNKRRVPLEAVAKSIDGVRLIHGDLKKVGKEIGDESVDVIITDPPYPKEFLPVYDSLADLAERVLKKNGSLFVMIGHSYLPEIIEKLSKKLNYHWTLCYSTEGGQATQLWDRKILTYWKPILWFVKGKFKGDWSSDVVKSGKNDNDKRFHKWGQSESGFLDLINRYTLPHETVLDPFLGGGTTGVIAASLGRKFIGIDIDEKCIITSQKRIAEISK